VYLNNNKGSVYGVIIITDCESSPGSCDECSSGFQPLNQANWLELQVSIHHHHYIDGFVAAIMTYCYNFIIVCDGFRDRETIEKSRT